MSLGRRNHLPISVRALYHKNSTVLQYCFFSSRIPYIKQSNESTNKPLDLKCVLMLLSVLRKSGASDKLPVSDAEGGEEWRGLIGYEVLRQAAIDAVDEVLVKRP